MDYLLKHNKTIIASIVVIAIISGIVRIFSYKVGYYVLLLAIISYFIYRLLYFTVVIAKHKRLNRANKQHLIIFIALAVVVLFNNFDLLDAPFISLFLLLIDYLISVKPIKLNLTKNE